MIGRTLSLYIAARFAKTVLGMLISLLVLIVLVDFVEQLRKAAERPDIPVWGLLQISAFKAPAFVEKAFPFGCLFAAMITLTQLNNKLELVVARAAGVSAWQFIMPVSVVAALIGLFAAFVYNPISVRAFERSTEIQVQLFSAKDRKKAGEISSYWLRQEDSGGNSVINARVARKGGKILHDVKIIRYLDDGRIYERIDAKNAQFRDGNWVIADAYVTGNDAVSEFHSLYEIDTKLTEDILAGVTSNPETIPFWDLLRTAGKATLAGGNPNPYLVQFYSLLALPLFLVAMVVIASTVSLKFVRFGQVGRMIIGGILCGFVLYTVTKFVTSLGSNGIVPPVVAAWSPFVVAIFFGVSVLLHQEDG
ncbi:MAG: LPS export ABC transporter permease LptG [Pseudomonadota bacterium]